MYRWRDLLTDLIVIIALAVGLCFALTGCENGGSQSGIAPPVLYVFTSPTCRQCIVDRPTVEGLGRRVRIRVYDQTKHPQSFQRFGVKAMPTYIYVRRGKVKWRTHRIAEVVEQIGVSE